MFWTVPQAAEYLNLKLHQVHYLIQMGKIEAIGLTGQGTNKRKIWRIVPESVKEYKAKSAA